MFRSAIYLLSGKNRKIEENDTETKGSLVKINKKHFNNFDREEIEVNIRLSTMINDLNNFDEYQCFRDVLKTLKEKNSEVLMKLIQPLNKQEVEDLTEIIKSQRINIGSKTTEVRKILKPKSFK